MKALTDVAQYCTFWIDDLFFGVDVDDVQEVLRHQPMTPVPRASEGVQGLINLRGQIVTSLNLRERLRLAGQPADEQSVSVVVRTLDGGAVSLVVDRVGDVVEPDPGSLESPPETLDPRVRALVDRVCKLDGELMLMLDTELAVAVGGTDT
jgi:purine-binding chemotaxis protein CheW